VGVENRIFNTGKSAREGFLQSFWEGGTGRTQKRKLSQKFGKRTGK